MAIPINWWALLVTTIMSVIIGSLWFGPLFGKAWMNALGISMPETMTPEMKRRMNWSYFAVTVGALITNFVLLHSIVFGSAYLNISGVAAGFQAAFWNWLGFVAPVVLGSVLWESRPKKYFWITGGYYLVLLLINGVILSVWR